MCFCYKRRDSRRWLESKSCAWCARQRPPTTSAHKSGPSNFASEHNPGSDYISHHNITGKTNLGVYKCNFLFQYFVPSQQTAILKQTVMTVAVTTTDITLSFIRVLGKRRKCFSECQREQNAKRGKDVFVRKEGRNLVKTE